MTSPNRAVDIPDLFDDQEAPSAMTLWARSTRTGKAKKPRSERPKKTTMAAAVFDRARAEMQAMIDSQNFAGCSARHIVALYDLMHVKVYGVEVSMSGSERHTYTLRAGGFIKREFSGDYTKAIAFFRWLWAREMGREKWRRETGNEGGRLDIGQSISGKSITDYRLALARRL